MTDGHGPMVGGVPEQSVRGDSPLDHDGPTRPFHDGCDAEVAFQGARVGPSDVAEGFGEDGGQKGGSDAGNGPQEFDGASARSPAPNTSRNNRLRRSTQSSKSDRAADVPTQLHWSIR